MMANSCDRAFIPMTIFIDGFRSFYGHREFFLEVHNSCTSFAYTHLREDVPSLFEDLHIAYHDYDTSIDIGDDSMKDQLILSFPTSVSCVMVEAGLVVVPST